MQTSKSLNGFVYFLRKIPGFKRLFKNTDYSFPRFKRFLSVFSVLYKLISGPISLALIFLLAIYLPAATLAESDITSSIMILLISFYFIFPFLNSTSIQVEEEKFIMVKQLRMNPKDYTIAKTAVDSVFDIWSKTILFGLVFRFLLGQEFILGFSLALSSVSFAVFAEAIHLYLYEKIKFSINNKTILQIISYTLVIVVTYVLVIFTKIPESLNILSFFQYGLSTIAFLFLGMFGCGYMVRYKYYWDIINEKNTVDAFQGLNELMGDANFHDVKIKDKDYDEKSLTRNDSIDKVGYDYLNHIFFLRHKKTFYKLMIVKTLIVIGVFTALFAIDMFFIDGFGIKITDVIIDRYSMFIIIMYFLCNSEKLIRSMFYNCDRSLLRYGFYKRGNSLLKMFFLRLRKIIYGNSLPVLALMVGIYIATAIYSPTRIGEIIPILISILLLGLFFSVHYIFMYYIFQPFSDSLKIKNPFYSIINFIVYLISYLFMRLELSSDRLLPIITTFSVIYIVLAVSLVYKKGPDTFRIK